MKPIDQARADLNAAEARGENDDFMKHFAVVIEAADKMKKAMVAGGLTAARDKCPKCQTSGALHGRLVVGSAAGRHRRSGGAFRMWCDVCPGVRMME